MCSTNDTDPECKYAQTCSCAPCAGYLESLHKGALGIQCQCAICKGVPRHTNKCLCEESPIFLLRTGLGEDKGVTKEIRWCEDRGDSQEFHEPEGQYIKESLQVYLEEEAARCIKRFRFRKNFVNLLKAAKDWRTPVPVLNRAVVIGHTPEGLLRVTLEGAHLAGDVPGKLPVVYAGGGRGTYIGLKPWYWQAGRRVVGQNTVVVSSGEIQCDFPPASQTFGIRVRTSTKVFFLNSVFAILPQKS